MRKKHRFFDRKGQISACCLFMVVTLVLISILPNHDVKPSFGAVSLANPQIVTDDDMEAGQRVTYDCVWFGSYPQAEVVSSAMADNYTAVDAACLRGGDLVVDSILYTALQSATGWDTNGDITYNGKKYRRMKKGDAIHSADDDSDYYNWSDSSTYHYFLYQPIKWRVLITNGYKALLLSDVVLDDQSYDGDITSVTWESSTIRSWLNGYGEASGGQDIDYSGKSFIDAAFTSVEQSAIEDTLVLNEDNRYYDTEGGNNTTDKVFLLSESQVCTDAASAYGFAIDSSTSDEARRAKSSTYAKAMGLWQSTDLGYEGNCQWWLRTPGSSTNMVVGIAKSGFVGNYGVNTFNIVTGVRPALYLDLTASASVYSYAGTVCSDGTVSEEEPAVSSEGTAEPGTAGSVATSIPSATASPSPSPKPTTAAKVSVMDTFSVYVNYVAQNWTESINTSGNPVQVGADGTYALTFTPDKAATDIYRLALDTSLKETDMTQAFSLTPVSLLVGNTAYNLGNCDKTKNDLQYYRVSIRDKSNYRLANSALGSKTIAVAAKTPITINFTITGMGKQTALSTASPENPVSIPDPVPYEVTKEDLKIKSVQVKSAKSKKSGICRQAVSIKWATSPYASGYGIYRSTKAKKGFKKIGEVSAKNGVQFQQYKDKKVKRGRVYYYKVSAWYWDGKEASEYTRSLSKAYKVKVAKSLVTPKVRYSRKGNNISIHFTYAEGSRFRSQYRYKGQKKWKSLPGLSGKLKETIKNKKIRSRYSFSIRFSTSLKVGKKTVRSKWSKPLSIK